MSVMDILRQYAERPTDTHADFDEVAREISPTDLGQGVTEAFKSEQTPEFGDMVGKLFGGSNSAQRAGLLNQILQSVGPGMLSTVAGGVLGKFANRGQGSAVPVTEADVANVSPQAVQEAATAAAKQDPSVLDRLGAFYGQHPDVVKSLGGAALAIALGHIAMRRKS